AQFPRSKFRALISRPRFSHPHMQWQAALMPGVDRRRRGTVINKCQPTCVAMSKHINALVRPRFRNLLNERHTVLPDHSALLGAFARNQISGAQRQRYLFIGILSSSDGL